MFFDEMVNTKGHQSRAKTAHHRYCDHNTAFDIFFLLGSGSDHTAQDYVYAVKRILDPNTEAKYVDFLLGYIVGADEFYADNSIDFETVGVKAPDDRTFVMTLKAPAPYWIDILAMWTFSPVQQATIEANGERWTASADTYVTNGPFRMAEINMGESFVLEKNPYYYDADAVNTATLR